MPEWLRGLLRLAPKEGGPAFPKDTDLLSFFTNVDHVIAYFEEQLSAAATQRRLVVIHGVGGIGKSSLLAKLRSSALNAKVPVAYSSA